MTVCACGTEVSALGADVLCPACLIRLALESNALADEPPATSEPARLLGPVGRGPHGTVHLAYRPLDPLHFVTVKLMDARPADPIDAKRFCQRVRDVSHRLGSVTRAGLPEFRDAGVTADTRVYVVAPYVPGPSIADYVTSRHSSAAQRVDLAASLCTLVADLHQHGIIHGSIKPTNVIVTESRNGPYSSLLDVGVVPALSHSRGPARSPDGEASTLEGEKSDVRSLLVLLTSLLWDSTTPAIDRAESAAALAAMLAHP